MEFNPAALQSSIDVINATNGAVLNVTKFVIESGSMLRHSKFLISVLPNKGKFCNTIALVALFHISIQSD